MTGYGAVINDVLIALIMLENPSFFGALEELARLLSRLLAKIMAFERAISVILLRKNAPGASDLL
jgi:hypothetical protein